MKTSDFISFAQVTGVIVVVIVIIDVAVNALLPIPDNPQVRPNKLQQYFEYGRSVEGKLRYMVREDDEETAFIAQAGWITDEVADVEPYANNGGLRVAVYGQSMSNRIGQQMQAIDNCLDLRLQGGPAAPISHSYELYRQDERGRQNADVAILSVVASGIRMIPTMTSMGWAFESPMPYTYPRWTLNNGKLEAIQPIINSLPELRAAMQDEALWQQFVDQLVTHDESFSPVLFNRNFSDKSAFLRLLKRGYGQRHQDQFDSRYVTVEGFTGEDNIVEIANGILTRFAEEARQAGELPVVLLLHDRWMNDFLYDAVHETLTSHDIPFFSSHQLAPANDPQTYVADGHFQHEYDVLFAQEILELLQSRGVYNGNTECSPSD